MGRDKLKRNLQFKPLYKRFSSNECKTEETIHLLHEEMEALFLMDSKELYQADSAKEMGVSRPTFARILKNARQKVTMMLITGSNLQIDDEKSDVLIMIPSQKKESIVDAKPTALYLHIYNIEKQKVFYQQTIENPAYQEKIRPGQILPQLCSQYKINFFITESLGEGLKSALLSKGIHSKIEKEITQKNIEEYGKYLF
jgi:predicted DNA-binding protein (UPF0251 family)